MLFDYSSVTPESITSDVDRTLAEADLIVEEVIDSTNAPTFASTLGRLEDITEMTASLFGRTGFMGYVHPDETMRTVGQELEERISKWGIEITFRPDLYAAVKAFAESDEASALTGEGIEALWAEVERCIAERRASGEFDAHVSAGRPGGTPQKRTLR